MTLFLDTNIKEPIYVVFWTRTRTRTFWTRNSQDSSPEINDLNGRSSDKHLEARDRRYSCLNSGPGHPVSRKGCVVAGDSKDCVSDKLSTRPRSTPQWMLAFSQEAAMHTKLSQTAKYLDETFFTHESSTTTKKTWITTSSFSFE